MSNESFIFHFLAQLRRRARGTLLVWTALAVLTGLALCGASRLNLIGWGAKPAVAAVGIAVLLLVWWFKRVRRLTPTALARELDARWNLKSHLESATNLSTDDSLWARAQRQDAMCKLDGREPPGAVPWIAGLILCTVALFLLGIEGTVAAWRTWASKPPAAVAAATPPPAPTPEAAPPSSPSAKPEIRASIVWKSPEDQIKATAIEEVPLVAYAESDSGFRSVALHYTVNGGSEGSIPIDAPALGASAGPGGHELKPSLYLDELKVKEFDIVAYHLVGELNSPTPGSVASPLQFIQIRKTQSDMALSGGGGADRLVNMIRGLEISQIELIKKNFALIHSPEGQGELSWKLGNERVTSDQSALAGTAAETRQEASTEDAPAELLGDLDQAGSAMKEAGAKIGARENSDGATSQNRALALVVACEKFIGLGAMGQAAPSPFKDDQAFTMPPRPATPAGQLEQLARRQQQSNQSGGDSAGPQSSGATQQSSAADNAKVQTAIAEDAKKLDEGGNLDQPVKSLLHAAAAAADEAAKQLALNDPAAARVPAAEAEQKFEEAVAAQEKSGRAHAAALLDSTRRTLNAASRLEDDTARKSQLVAIRQSLRTAAMQEQQTGSSDAAHLLAALASLVDAPAVRSDSHPSEPYSVARSRELAVAAARTQVILMSPGVALDRAIRQLNLIGKPGPADASGSSPVPPGDLLDNLEMSSQEAEWLTDDPATTALAQKIADTSYALQKTQPTGADLTLAAESAGKLAAALVRGRPNRPRDEIVRRFQSDDVDPRYRPAVETYFEHLSRDGAPAQSASSK